MGATVAVGARVQENSQAKTGRSGEPAASRRLGVDFPFRLVLDHPPIGLHAMFEVTEAFDLYEVRGIAGENAGHARKDLYVDVVEVTPTSTTLVVTPTRMMTYGEIAAEAEAMVQGIGQHVFSGKAKAAKLSWVVDKTGLPSDMRGRLHVVT